MRIVVKIVIALLSTASALLLIASNFASSMGPSVLKIVTVLGIMFEYLVFLNVLMVVLAAFFGKYFAVLPLVAIGIAFPKPFDIIQFHSPSPDTEIANDEAVKVLSYNVKLFNKNLYKKDEFLKDSIISFLKSENADVYLLQEFYHHGKKKSRSTYRYVPEQLNTPYAYYEHRERRTGIPDYFFGLAVFSKYPITDQGIVVTYKGGKAQAVFADIQIGKRTVRVYNIHLQSLGFKTGELDFLKQTHDIELNNITSSSKSIINRVVAASEFRVSQVKAIEDHMRNCKHPILIAGDFNETPYSFNANAIGRYMKDGFIHAGSGLGFTYEGVQFVPPLRIDYIFASSGFDFHSFTTHDIDYSDHKPVSAMLRLRR